MPLDKKDVVLKRQLTFQMIKMKLTNFIRQWKREGIAKGGRILIAVIINFLKDKTLKARHTLS